MGNNFDDDDFDFDDDFSFDDDAGGDDLRSELTDDDFTFDDDFSGSDADIDDLGLDDDSEFEFEEDLLGGGDDDDLGDGPRQGTNRTFILLAALMIVLFVIGLVAVVILASRPNPVLVAATQTSAAVIAFNSTLAATATEGALAQATIFAEETQTAVVVFASQTAQAAVPVATILTNADVRDGPGVEFPVLGVAPAGTQATVLAQSQFGDFYRVEYPGGAGWVSAAEVSISGNMAQVAVEFVATPTPEVFETPIPDPTDLALTQIVADLTATAQFTPGETAIAVEPTSDIADADAVRLTATALANIFITPSPEVIGTPGGGQVITRPTQLPDTGLLDDVIAGGSGGFGALLLIAFGLVGVIVFSRRMRDG